MSAGGGVRGAAAPFRPEKYSLEGLGERGQRVADVQAAGACLQVRDADQKRRWSPVPWPKQHQFPQY